MTIRSSRTTVTFARPVVFDGVERPLPAGVYSVETDEERLEGLSFPVYRRVRSMIDLPAQPDHPGRRETLTLDPSDLDAALRRDQARAAAPTGALAGERPAKQEGEACRRKADRQAIERAENEGMPGPPA
jgi:hypothetical protein